MSNSDIFLYAVRMYVIYFIVPLLAVSLIYLALMIYT